MQHNLYPQTLHARASYYDEAWFETIFVALDRLHDAASQECLTSVSPVAPADMVGWLEDIIYTAQEAIVEIRDNEPDKTVTKAGPTG